MTLGELKQNTTKVLEEYKNDSGANYADDADIRRKMCQSINAVISEVSKIQAIEKTYTYTQTEAGATDLPNDYYTVTDVRVKGVHTQYYDIYAGKIIALAVNTPIEVRYDAIPEQYDDTTPDTTELPFKDNVCRILPYGVCSLLLLATGRINDANEVKQTYYAYLQELKPTANKVKLHISGYGSVYK